MHSVRGPARLRHPEQLRPLSQRLSTKWNPAVGDRTFQFQRAGTPRTAPCPTSGRTSATAASSGRFNNVGANKWTEVSTVGPETLKPNTGARKDAQAGWWRRSCPDLPAAHVPVHGNGGPRLDAAVRAGCPLPPRPSLDHDPAVGLLDPVDRDLRQGAAAAAQDRTAVSYHSPYQTEVDTPASITTRSSPEPVIVPVVGPRAPGRRTAALGTMPTINREPASQPVHPLDPAARADGAPCRTGSAKPHTSDQSRTVNYERLR